MKSQVEWTPARANFPFQGSSLHEGFPPSDYEKGWVKRDSEHVNFRPSGPKCMACDSESFYFMLYSLRGTNESYVILFVLAHTNYM